MNRTKILLRFSALYAVIGAFMGSHMAGSGSYMFRAIHAHILVVGWLSLFSFAIFYAVFAIPKHSKLAIFHVWTAIIGSFGLTTGMWMYNLKVDFAPETFSMVFYIVGGSTLLISFIVFGLMAVVFGKHFVDKQS
ncbi:hypothetical protein SM124_18425 [Bacillus sp. 31A1R]|uniref:Cytochrome C and Quinol oxidase polypeptide I n=1 Tax=Robertmurraya mangrovi TaxID=3098077 RepID=A0ABU5J2P5_9BACI|nr:hypothetical protein [Bacillus sp. 31A1R]MDZ5473697.1 hypothetical protein [Bacillus sp. 31A1R]